MKTNKTVTARCGFDIFRKDVKTWSVCDSAQISAYIAAAPEA